MFTLATTNPYQYCLCRKKGYMYILATARARKPQWTARRLQCTVGMQRTETPKHCIYMHYIFQKYFPTLSQWCSSRHSSLSLETSRESRLSFNVLVLGCKALVLVSSWNLHALVLGLRSSAPCTKVWFFGKGSFSPKSIIFRGFRGKFAALVALQYFSIICSN